MKEKLIIKNFGPIKDVELELGRFNVLIGEQATGKSTVAKLLAVCRNFFAINPNVEGNIFGDSFRDSLNNIGLSEFLKSESFVRYANKDYEFKCQAILKSEIEPEFGMKRWIETNSELHPRSERFEKLLDKYKNLFREGFPYEFPVTFSMPQSLLQEELATVSDNVIYIPAERGLQSIFSLGKSSIQNLSDELFNQFANLDRISRLFKSETVIEPLNIIYKNENGQGLIRKKSEESFYSLFNAATGYQSVIPIVLSVKYYNTIRRKKKTFLIEEPELNLFPTAQNRLMEFLVDVIMNNGHSILLTTHSPYILTSLNNCMYAAQVGKLNPDAAAKIIPRKNWLNITDVSAYRLMADGTAKSIVDKETNQLEVELIDEVSDELSREWHRLADLKFSNPHEVS